MPMFLFILAGLCGLGSVYSFAAGKTITQEIFGAILGVSFSVLLVGAFITDELQKIRAALTRN